MLDINFIRKNVEKVQKSATDKGYKVNVQDVIKIDDGRRELLQKVEKLRQERNAVAAQMKGGKPAPELIAKGKELKEQLASLEKDLDVLQTKLNDALRGIPNLAADDAPVGGEEDSVTIREWGEKRDHGIDHLDYAKSRDWVDFERGAKVAGAKFYYLKNELALLENAITQFALNKVTEQGFRYMIVPDLVSSKVLTGTGFNPRSSDQSDEYFVEGEDLALIATAEIPLTGYHMDEILDEKDLPLLYTGYSACFRKEAGTYGKHTRGLFRVHQFNKLEMYIYCLPEKSVEMHEKILAVEESIWQDLGIPYRVVNIATGDLGCPTYKKYDIEYWSPVDQTYRELTSCSNCTDYQARGLNIRVRRADKTVETVHTLNGTAVSLARTIVAFLENYATEGGKVQIPEVLRPYLQNRSEL